MSPRGSVEIGIKVTADTSGAQKAVDAFSQVRQQTLDMARANGANEESVRRLGIAYDQLAATWDTLQEMRSQNLITDEEGMAAWAEAEKKVTDEIRAMGLAAKRTGDEVEKAGEQTKKAGGLVDWFANANGRSAGTLRVSNERTVLLGQAMAGLVAQYTMGADAQSLFMSGATNIAMMMSTAGPWGMAAGFATQALAVLVQKYYAVEKAEQAAAEKQIAAMEARVDAARKAAGEEESYAKAVERTAIAIDLKISAMERERQYEEGRKKAAADAATREAELQKMRDKEAVAKGDMTPEAALENDVLARDKALHDQQVAEIEAIEQRRNEAITKRTAAEEQFRANKEAMEKEQADAKAARAVADAQVNARAARETIEKEQAAIDSRLTSASLSPEQQAEIDAKNAASQAAIERSRKVIADSIAQETQAREGRPFLKTLEEEKAEAEKAAEAYDTALPGLYKQQQDAATAYDDADMAREEVKQKHRDEREKFKLGLSEEERAIVERAGDATPDDTYTGPPRPLVAPVDAKGAAVAGKQAADQSLEQNLGKLADAAKEGNEGDKQVAARIAEAAKALGDGGTKDELVKVGAALMEAGQLNDAAAKDMLKAAKKALQDAKEALRRVKDLESQVNAL